MYHQGRQKKLSLLRDDDNSSNFLICLFDDFRHVQRLTFLLRVGIRGDIRIRIGQFWIEKKITTSLEASRNKSKLNILRRGMAFRGASTSILFGLLINRSSMYFNKASVPRSFNEQILSTISLWIIIPDRSFVQWEFFMLNTFSLRRLLMMRVRSWWSISWRFGAHSTWESMEFPAVSIWQISCMTALARARKEKEFIHCSTVWPLKRPSMPPCDFPYLFIVHSMVWSRAMSMRKSIILRWYSRENTYMKMACLYDWQRNYVTTD